MRYFLLIILVCNGVLSIAGNRYPADSIGIEKNNGKTYVLHRVEDKETLYSLSRRYNVPIYSIIENNPPVEFGLEIGQIIKIPYIKKEAKAVPQLSAGDKIHEVKPKETIFSISRLYGITIEELKAWNNLQTNILDIGQKLVIRKHKLVNKKPDTKDNIPGDDQNVHTVGAGETLYSLSKKYQVSIDQLMQWNNLSANEISIGQRIIIGKERPKDERPVKNVSLREEPIMVSADTSNSTPPNTGAIREIEEAPARSTTFEEVLETGNAELIEGSENTRKYLALHRTAMVGTILKVRNEMNGQEVFVRVMGKLPDTGVNRNLLIKISKSAYERLGAIDPRFRVAVSYIP